MQRAKRLESRYDFADVLENPSGLVITFHDDEEVRMYDTGCRDINELKRSLWNDFQEQRIPGEPFMDDFEPEALGTSISLDNADKINNAEALWRQVSDTIADSEVDGDSSYGINLIDIKTRRCILGQSVD